MSTSTLMTPLLTQHTTTFQASAHPRMGLDHNVQHEQWRPAGADNGADDGSEDTDWHEDDGEDTAPTAFVMIGHTLQAFYGGFVRDAAPWHPDGSTHEASETTRLGPPQDRPRTVTPIAKPAVNDSDAQARAEAFGIALSNRFVRLA